MKTSALKSNPDNPRKISTEQLDRLKKSVQEFSKMMELRPMVYDPETMIVLGGNQRLAAIKALGMKEIPDNWTMPATGDRKQYTIWKPEYSDAEIAAAVRAAYTHAVNGAGTIWQVGRDSNYVHPTQKPILLVAKAIENSTKRGDIILDGFLGSGTTLVAAHMTERICYGVELDPKYCQCIIDRMKILEPDIQVEVQHIV